MTPIDSVVNWKKWLPIDKCNENWPCQFHGIDHHWYINISGMYYYINSLTAQNSHFPMLKAIMLLHLNIVRFFFQIQHKAWRWAGVTRWTKDLHVILLTGGRWGGGGSRESLKDSYFYMNSQRKVNAAFLFIFDLIPLEHPPTSPSHQSSLLYPLTHQASHHSSIPNHQSSL
jgi:hypothetical protein